jgi:hypothetical protein
MSARGGEGADGFADHFSKTATEDETSLPFQVLLSFMKYRRTGSSDIDCVLQKILQR